MILAVLVFLLPASAAQGAPTVPDDFESLPLADGVHQPTDVAWAPDGRMFVSELAGVVRVVDPALAPRATKLLDISDHVNSFGERGLTGIAVDRDFAANGYLYLLYTYEADASDPDGAKTGRLTRVRVNPDGTVTDPPDPETVLVEGIPSPGLNHTVTDVEVAPDGTLYVGTGDGLASRGPRPGAFDTYDAAILSGKVLHVDRGGQGLSGHPFCPDDDDLSHACTKVHAVGLRNPWRLTVDAAGRLFVGDVGWHQFEEIDLVSGGENLGWPCWEGPIQTPGYLDDPLCADFYANQLATPPIHTYQRSSSEGASITLGPVLGGAAYPPEHRGWLYFADFANGLIRRLRVDGDGSVEHFGTASFPSTVRESPAGELVIASFTDDAVHRIAYAPGNKTPLALLSAEPRWGDLPLTVSFRASDSSDPDGNPLTYLWDFGDGATSTEPDPTHTYAQAGPRQVRLTVSDGDKSAARAVTVWPGDTAPQIDVPAPPSSYSGGEHLTLEAVAHDAEDGALTGASVRWEINLRHRDHLHPLLSHIGTQIGFTVPQDHDADTHLEVTVTARDEAQLPASHSFDILPRTAPLRLDSQPPGAVLSYAGAAVITPWESIGAVGFLPVVTAEEAFAREGREYRFSHWSDGGARVHGTQIGADGLRLVAYYADAGASAASGEPGQSVLGTATVRRHRPALIIGPSRLIPAGRTLRMALRCPADNPGSCRGTLVADRRARRRGAWRWSRLASTSYALAPGRRRSASLRLTTAQLALLQRLGGLRVRLRAIEPVAERWRWVRLRPPPPPRPRR